MAFSRQLHSYIERTAYRQTLPLYKQWILQPLAASCCSEHSACAVLLLVVSEYINIFELKHNGMTTPKFIRTTIRLFAKGRSGPPCGTHYACQGDAAVVASDITPRVLATCLATADI
jgi:hypothetical protein